MVDEEEKPPQPSHPPYEPSSPPPPAPSSSGSLPLTKEQLLLRMEAVDREIAATEAQIVSLQKRQAELEGSISSSPSPLHSSPLPSPSEREGPEEEGVSSLTATPAERWGTPKRSILESVYSENKVKARTAHAVLHHLSPSLSSSITTAAAPLYTQPWEAPGYFNIIARHRHFRSKLVQLIGRQKRERHEKVVHIPLPLLPPQTSSLAHTSLPPGRTCCCVRGTMTTRRSGRRDWTRLRTAPRESNRLRLPLTETTTSSASCLSCLSLSLLQSKRLEEQRAV
jgi:hypothetical protein